MWKSLGDKPVYIPSLSLACFTSAVPMFIKECNNYGVRGVLANNQFDCNTRTIQNLYQLHGEKLLIALVVSMDTQLSCTAHLHAGFVLVH